MSYITAAGIVSPLGFSTRETFDRLVSGVSSVRAVNDEEISPEQFWASLIRKDQLDAAWSEMESSGFYTKFEKITLLSVDQATRAAGLVAGSKNTGLILCTTKGNIDLLDNDNGNFGAERIYLWKSAEVIAGFLKIPNTPVVISNACISGLLGIVAGHRMLSQGLYKHVIVAGADVVSPFVVSGFQSFKSLADGICRPFDVRRNGLNLGEGSATVVMSAKGRAGRDIRVLGGAGTNDANHISGPSRTGEGLGRAIQSALKQGGIGAGKIDVISAHGTATPYNDEMEAKALALAGVEQAPLNSLKGYFGHTLGAAGLMETVILLESMRQGVLPATKGFERPGVSVDLNVSGSNVYGDFNTGLKTGSGFGGCNAAAVFSKA